MKKISSLLLLLFVLTISSYAQNLKAYFTHCTFYSPLSGPYIETYLSIVGNSINYVKNENNTFQGSIEITYLFKQGEEIKQFKKYNLLSPELADTSSEKVNFIDQQRISLPAGSYEFEILMKDLNSSHPPFKNNQIININYNDKKMAISDIELIESLKMGMI